ncbi:MAG: hypothetical protein ABR976_20145 [Terracidiphilus sp.]|jgi:hypothetical protein
MQEVRWFRALLLVAIAFVIIPSFSAQTTDAIQAKLNSQFKLTRTTADRTDIVTAGDVVQLHKPGLIMYAVASPLPPANSYKNGKIGQGWGGFGKDLVIGMAAPGGATAANYPHRPFVADEKCWVTGIEVQKDGILFHLYSDPYDDTRYYANLKIPFPDKKTIPLVDAAVQLVAEVLTVVSQEDQGGQQTPADQGTAVSQDPLAQYEGAYFRKDKTSDSMLLAPGGVFWLVQNGRRYEGNYSVEGEVLTVWGPKIPGRQKCSLVGNVITDPGKTIWERTAAPAAAESPAEPSSSAGGATEAAQPPAPIQAIPPPPPPTDMPPVTIAVRQTKEQVTAAFGQPLRLAKVGAKEIYYYKDMKVTFLNGKVSDVE